MNAINGASNQRRSLSDSSTTTSTSARELALYFSPPIYEFYHERKQEPNESLPSQQNHREPTIMVVIKGVSNVDRDDDSSLEDVELADIPDAYANRKLGKSSIPFPFYKLVCSLATISMIIGGAVVLSSSFTGSTNTSPQANKVSEQSGVINQLQSNSSSFSDKSLSNCTRSNSSMFGQGNVASKVPAMGP